MLRCVCGGLVNSVKLLTLIFVGLCSPTYAWAQGADFLKAPPKPYLSRGRTFSVNLPANWGVQEPKNTNETRFIPPGPGVPFLSIRRMDVPRHVHPRQIALRAIELRLSKLPGYRQINRRDVTVGGSRAVSLTATYDHQGNIQYKRVVEEVYIVAGSEAFVIHFECFLPSAPLYAKSLEVFYSSFLARPGAGTGVFDTADGNEFPDVQELPF